MSILPDTHPNLAQRASYEPDMTIYLLPVVRGCQWAVSRTQNVAWILDDGDPRAIGRRTGEALAALSDRRPALRLVQGGAR